MHKLGSLETVLCYTTNGVQRREMEKEALKHTGTVNKL